MCTSSGVKQQAIRSPPLPPSLFPPSSLPLLSSLLPLSFLPPPFFTIQCGGELALNAVLFGTTVQVDSDTCHGSIRLGVKVCVILDDAATLEFSLYIACLLSELAECCVVCVCRQQTRSETKAQ